MAILNNPEDFVSGENITATKLNNLVDGATFLGGAGQATDDSTLEVNDGVGGDGSLRVKDSGITSAKLADNAVIESKIADNAVTLSKIAASAANLLMPVGAVIPFAGYYIPSGWLLCDGRAVSRTTYSDLYSVIGSQHGVGDGVTTFEVPDLRGRVVAGLDDNSAMNGWADRLTRLSAADIDGKTLGQHNGDPGDPGRGAKGAQEHQLTVDELAQHRHSLSDGVGTKSNSFDSGTLVASDASGFTAYTGGDQAHNNVQPTIILWYIIKH